jgi:hypothetical protein
MHYYFDKILLFAKSGCYRRRKPRRWHLLRQNFIIRKKWVLQAEKAATLASTHKDAEGLVWKVILLEGELAEARRAREVVEENIYGLSDVAVDGARRLVVSKRERREQFEEFTLLHTRGSELCLDIVGPPQVRNDLSKGMRSTALCHTEMAGELATLWMVVSSIMESVLGHSPDETFPVEVVGELVTEFQWLEKRRSWLKQPSARICDLLLGLPPDQASLANHLDEAT